MLKSSELRIGNWVHLPSKGKDYQILSGHDIEEIEDSGDAIPVMITIGWLEKFGFKYTESLYTDGWDDLWVKGPCELYNSPFKEGWTVESLRYNIEIYNIHQLQNLYFALTHKELELVTTPQHS